MTLPCSKKTISIIKRKLHQKNNGDFYCLNFLHSFRTKIKLESHRKVCENKEFRSIAITFEDINQYQKSDKVPSIIYADLECLIKKFDGCKNNPENSSTTEVGEGISSGF